MNNKILIIDDNPDICLVMKEILEKDQHIVFTAISGKEGITTARKQKPDLIFLDIVMDKMDGFSVLDELKKSKDTLAIPVVMLTGQDDEASRIKTASSYSDDYLVKPVNPEVIQAKVKQVLEGRGK